MSRSRHPSPQVLLALFGLVLAGCSSWLDPVPVRGPADPDAEVRSDLLVAAPAVVAPGAELGLRFPDERIRGIHFVLEIRTGSTWDHRFDLTSDAGPGHGLEPAWYAATDEGFGVEDLGVGGPGPDIVPIPETAEPGSWRICTGNAAPNICTPIEIGGG